MARHRLSRRKRDRGDVASLVSASRELEMLEPRRLLAFALNVNFQPGGAPVPSGYVADAGLVYGDRGNGYTYGWNAAISSATRDRNDPASPDQRYDTLVHTQLYGTRTWEVSVPNGTYDVHLVSGDPDYIDSVDKYDVEGVLALSGTPTNSNHWITGDVTVNVTDGRLTISNDAAGVNNKLDFVQITGTDATPPPVSGITIPGTIEAENFDDGGQNISYFDTTAGNSGGQYRSTDVDLIKASEGGYAVGYTRATEWLNYTINAASTATYNLDVRVASAGAGGTFHISIDGTNVSGEMNLPNTGGWQNWTTVSASGINISAGQHTLRLTFDAVNGSGDMGNVNWMKLSTATNPPPTNPPPTDSNWPTTWTAGAPIPKLRWESSSLEMDGKIWVFGGWMSASTIGTQAYDVYDIASGTWKAMGYAPIANTHAAPAPDPANHVIYFAGGLFGNYPGVPTNQVWKYDTINNTWTAMPAMPENHSSGALALVNNQLHYIGGVLDDRETNTGRHLVLDLGNLAAGWQVAPDMPDPRDHFAHVVLDGKIICIGGEFGHDKTHDQQSLVDEYDPIAKTWTRLAALPTPKSHDESSTWLTSDGKIICAGGQIADFKSTDEVDEYDPATDAWSIIGRLPVPLQGPVVQQYGNEIIVTTGNKGDNAPLNNLWIGYLT